MFCGVIRKTRTPTYWGAIPWSRFESFGETTMAKDDDIVFDPDSDDEYDYLKENWVLGDEPMTDSQRREQESWEEECRRNKWR